MTDKYSYKILFLLCKIIQKNYLFEKQKVVVVVDCKNLLLTTNIICYLYYIKVVDNERIKLFSNSINFSLLIG